MLLFIETSLFSSNLERSIAATAANKGFLTPATDFDGEYNKYTYHFDANIYKNRVFDSHGVADPDAQIQFGLRSMILLLQQMS